MTHAITRHERGTFDDACKRAIAFANHNSGDLDMVACFLDCAGWGKATFGVESVSVADRELHYLNTGDTYDLTVGQENGGPVFSTSWGDWLEETEKTQCEIMGVIRCGNCGDFTPVGDGEWHNVICEHCGRNVSTGE